MDENSKYRDLFFEEADEYLKTLNDSILQLERNPEDSDLLDVIFRAAHTLKGMAATMGYETMTELTHSMENVFELFRSSGGSVNSESISLIFSGIDKLSEIVEDLRANRSVDYNIKELLEKLDQVFEGKDTPGDVLEGLGISLSNDKIDDTDLMVIDNAHKSGYDAYQIIVELQENCQLKGTRAYLVMNKLEEKGDIIHSNPSPVKIENSEFGLIFKLIFLSRIGKEEIEDIVMGTAEIEAVHIEEIDPSQYRELEAKINKEKKSAGETKTKEISKGIKRTQQHINESIRVDLSRLDNIMNLVSELVIYRTRLEDISHNNNYEEIWEPLEQVASITSQLQDLVLNIRMQPVEVVLNRFPRMIRDLSNELNKDIQLVIEGEDTELDRTVVTELGEPLVHILRNAADHGIETMEERLEKGKSKTGLIKLSAFQEGSRVVITVSDDGKGIDPEVIKKNAEKKGIDTSHMSDKELVELIFNPTFSTVEEVTNVSGRGVGMDVVKQKISSLGGEVQVESQVNQGTTFVIKLPLTLSIIQALLIRVGEQVFALQLGIIERVEKIEDGEIFESHNGEVYVYEGNTIPLIRLSEKLEIESSGQNNHIIIVLLGDRYYGLLVDDFIGQQEIVIKKLLGALRESKEYLGATILGNGEVILILDAVNLCNMGKEDIIG